MNTDLPIQLPPTKGFSVTPQETTTSTRRHLGSHAPAGQRVLCRGPESNWRHMVLQVNSQRLRGFVLNSASSSLGWKTSLLVRVGSLRERVYLVRALVRPRRDAIDIPESRRLDPRMA